MMCQESNIHSCNRKFYNSMPNPWPASHATVRDFVVKFRKYIEKQLQSYDVYLVFDRYTEYSTIMLQEFHVGL